MGGMKTLRVPSVLGGLLRPAAVPQAVQARWAHKEAAPPTVPAPIPLVPDVPTFLTVIGRGLSQHAAKFPTWEALFSLTSPQLKELGIEPPRTRRYLIRWRQRFRLGQFGIGGELRHVENGVAELRIKEIQKDPLTRFKAVVNVPAGQDVDNVPVEELSRVKGYTVHSGRTISGPYAMPIKDGVGSRVTVTEGMWEDRRGHKVDGGERRQAEVRFWRRVNERRARRERAGLR